MQTRAKRRCRKVMERSTRAWIEPLVSRIKDPVVIGNLRLLCKEFARLIDPSRVQDAWCEQYVEQASECYQCGHSWFGRAPLDNFAGVKSYLLSWWSDDERILTDVWYPPTRVNSGDLFFHWKKRVKALKCPCDCGIPVFHVRVGATAWAQCPHDRWCMTCASRLGEQIAEEVRETMDPLSTEESGDEMYPPG